MFHIRGGSLRAQSAGSAAKQAFLGPFRADSDSKRLKKGFGITLKTVLLSAGLGCCFAAAVLAQSAPETADIPQPHLAKARALAERENTWNHVALINCYSKQNTEAQMVVKTPPPTKAFDNVYNIGIGSVTAWAITTSDGIILIDTLDNTDEAKQYIIGGLKSLGLDPMTIKDIIVTHGHADHFGGAHYLQETIPGAKLYMTQVDYDVADATVARDKANPDADQGAVGIARRAQKNYDINSEYAPKHDQVVTDGEKLTLGDETITMYITPGHSPGTISMIIPVKDHGKPHLLSFWGGTASAGLKPDMAKAYDDSMARFIGIAKAAHVDGFFSNHPSLDDSDGKLEHLRETPDMPNPFLVGLDDTIINYSIIKECNLNNADINAAKAKKAS